MPLGSRALLENISETKLLRESLLHSDLKKNDAGNVKVQSAYERIKQKYGKVSESKEKICFPESGSRASKLRSPDVAASPDYNTNPYLALIQS